MQDILIVGNITKDVYLRLDDHKNHFEKDQDDVDWLDFAFNGDTHEFFSRVAVFGGSAITKEVFTNFDINFSVSLASTEQKPIHRYILCHGDAPHYLSPIEFTRNKWVNPKNPPSWIYLDRSANITIDFVNDLVNYLEHHPEVKLSTFVHKYANINAPYFIDLLKRSTLIISDTKSKFPPHIQILNNRVLCQNNTLSWTKKEKEDISTHLTINQTLASTIFAALLRGNTVEKALKIGVANLELSTLNSTASLEMIQQYIEENR